ncbi:MAG TPA: polysaccharide biosynthesis/export family protein [Pyrinomonadaceae bacterium]
MTAVFKAEKRSAPWFMLGLVTVLLLAATAPAQTPVANNSITAPAKTTAANRSSEHYRIGPGDVLDVRVFNKPQFSRDGVRVDGRGMIRMPFIEGEIQAACMTEQQLADDIGTRYVDYLRSPQVDVFIREFQSQPVAVLGAVRAPSRFQLQRRVRLLELLSFAGGPTENAGRTIQIVHTTTSAACNDAGQLEANEMEASALDNYKLDETLNGADEANPFVRPGDVVSIAEADQAYVVGNVLRPSAIPLKESITVSRAIAMSGGLMPDTKTDRVRIVRQPPGSASKTEIFVDLKAIDRRNAEDVVLQAGDIIHVPVSGGKRLLRSLIGAVVPSIAQLPTRVIP